MKKPLVIISACQFTRLALESLIPADRYIVRVYSNVTTEVEFVLKTSCGYLLADIPSLPSGELVLLACLVRLRSDAGQWQVCLTGDSDWFDNAPAASLYNGFPRIGTMLTASRYQNQIIRWLLRPLPGDMSDFWLLTARELSVLKILMQGMSFSEIGFAPIFPDTCYHLTHYWLAAVDIPVASDNPVHYADAIRYNARMPLQGSLLPLTRLVWA